MSQTMTPTEVRSHAINIAMGTFLSSWEGTPEEAWTRLTEEEDLNGSEVDYITVWEPFECKPLEVVYNAIEDLIGAIVSRFS